MVQPYNNDGLIPASDLDEQYAFGVFIAHPLVVGYFKTWATLTPQFCLPAQVSSRARTDHQDQVSSLVA